MYSSTSWIDYLIVFLFLNCQVFRAVELAEQHQGNQKELWDKVLKDEYMCHAVTEAYKSFGKILTGLLKHEEAKWLVSIHLVSKSLLLIV